MTDQNNLKKNKEIELLAPAGSKESFYAGIRAGADAVYMAYEKFGARAYAGNFGLDDIAECIDFAHLYGKKVYLTVNTLVKEKEFPELEEFASSGIPSLSDGLIIQDLGVASFFSENYPLIPLHASTQMSVTGPEAAVLLMDKGFTRIVPARELSFEEIRDIYDRSGLEIECFIHGAMCYSYSGQCLLSSVLGGRSGNRGRCAQPCRLSYRIAGSPKDTETYPLSLKDMCTLEILPRILEAGVCSLKVEGRMKPAAYVNGVISVYRKYLDLYLSGNEYHVEKEDLKTLSGLYVRGNLSHGYYDRHNSKDMVTITSHGYNGSDKSDAAPDEIPEDVDNKYVPKIKVSFKADFRIGNIASLSASAQMPDGRHASASVSGDVVEKAQKASVSAEDIKKSLKKLGNTTFVTADDLIEIFTDEGIFYSLKGINELRRNVLSALKEELKFSPVQNDLLSDCGGIPVPRLYRKLPGYGYSFLIRTEDQLYAFLNRTGILDMDSVSRIYYEESLFADDKKVLMIDEIKEKTKIPVFAACSFIRRKGDDLSYIEKYIGSGLIEGLLVRNLEDLSYFSDNNDISVITDFGVYVWNHYAERTLNSLCAGATLPLELSNAECRDLRKNSDFYVERVIYGRAPLMISANCIRKTLKSCTKKDGFETIIDRKGISFPVYADCHHCLNVYYNSVPLILKDTNDVCKRIEFTTEDKDECGKLLETFVSGRIPEGEHTSGWAERPVM
ncbi:MAG: U32 family peptidase [Lachnospiraceae bacterium]|nr:U32 family peptidase [Lachnospiraceae bacterium]